MLNRETTMHGKHATMVRPTHERAIVGSLDTTRSPARDRVMVLVSLKAGLRVKAMASLTWAMVTDAAGQGADAMIEAAFSIRKFPARSMIHGTMALV